MSVGVPYGAGEDTVGRNIRIKKYQFPDGSIGLEPMEMAKRRARVLMDNYFGKAARLKQWLNNQKRRAVEDARTFSILGRCRWYTIPDEDDPERNQKLAKIGRDAGNQPIQSSNADILKIALAKFYAGLRGGKLNGPNLYGGARFMMAVHDEIVCTARNDYVGPVAAILEAAMTDAYTSISKVFPDGKTYWLKDIYNKGGCGDRRLLV